MRSIIFACVSCALLMACSSSHTQYRFDTSLFVHQFPASLVKDFEASSGMRVAWKSSLGWKWTIMDFNLRSDTLLGANVVVYDEKMPIANSVQIGRSEVLDRSYMLIQRLTGAPAILSESLTNVVDGSEIYIAKKGHTGGIVQTWHCDASFFIECDDLATQLKAVESKAIDGH